MFGLLGDPNLNLAIQLKLAKYDLGHTVVLLFTFQLTWSVILLFNGSAPNLSNWIIPIRSPLPITWKRNHWIPKITFSWISKWILEVSLKQTSSSIKMALSAMSSSRTKASSKISAEKFIFGICEMASVFKPLSLITCRRLTSSGNESDKQRERF